MGNTPVAPLPWLMKVIFPLKFGMRKLKISIATSDRSAVFALISVGSGLRQTNPLITIRSSFDLLAPESISSRNLASTMLSDKLLVLKAASNCASLCSKVGAELVFDVSPDKST